MIENLIMVKPCNHILEIHQLIINTLLDDEINELADAHSPIINNPYLKMNYCYFFFTKFYIKYSREFIF
jgi:hypothetical protein